MRIDSLKLKGITRYRDEVEVPFRDLGEGLIALVGRNGQGKSTILEAPFAGIHLEYATRPGTMATTVAHGKDAKIELELENGARYRALIAMDAALKTPKTEAYLSDENGAPINDGKVKTYREAVAKRFGSARLMLSAALCCQSKKGEFLSLSKTERKELLSEILDTAGLQELAETARLQARDLDRKVADVQTEIRVSEEERDRLADSDLDLEHMEDEHARLKAEIDEKRGEMEYTRTALLEARGRSAELAAKVRGGESARKLFFAEEARLKKLIDDQKRYEENAVQIQEGTDKYVAKLEETRKNLPEMEKAQAEVDRLNEEWTYWTKKISALHGDREAIREKIDRVVASQTRAALLRQEIETLQTTHSLIDRVPCKAEGEFAGCSLLKNAIDAGERIEMLEKEITSLDTEITRFEDLQRELDVLTEAINLHSENIHAWKAELRHLEPKCSGIESARDAGTVIEEKKAWCKEQIDHQNDLRSRVIAEANGVRLYMADLRKTFEDADLAVEELEMEKAEEADLTDKGLTLKGEIESLESDYLAADRSIVQAKERTARMEELTRRVQDLHESTFDLRADLNDWHLLESALGRNGIQALEIDAAGPELSALTNELLHACFGPRFEIQFVTQKEKKSGGMKEIFDVNVIDRERGRDGTVDLLSGGEKTIVSEAISLALAIYVGRHSGHKFETLWRDETAGSLDPDNAHRYVQMLRKAREISGAHQIVFIAQQPSVWEQADAIVNIEDGRVSVA